MANITHDLKCWPEPFKATCEGIKCFEYRKNDRGGFTVGDTLRLREWDPKNGGRYTGHCVLVRVTYLTDRFGVPKGYCVMSIVRQ